MRSCRCGRGLDREWLTAIGTAEAAILALYIGVIREHLRRPQLSLLFDRGTSDTALVRSSTST
jgi:hypothetical protein